MTALDAIILAEGLDDLVFEGKIEIIRKGENSLSPKYITFDINITHIYLLIIYN